jgi:hypothetical protein
MYDSARFREGFSNYVEGAMKTEPDETGRTVEDADSGQMSEAEIDATLEASFPASDPPAWTLGSDHRPDTEQPTESEDPEDD